MKLAAHPRAPGVCPAFLRRQETTKGPEAASFGLLAAIGSGRVEGPLQAGNRLGEFLTRSTLGVAGSIMAGRGVVGISARDKGRCIVVECSLPLLHRLLQLRSLLDFACQFCAEGAFDKLAEDLPLVWTLIDEQTRQFCLERLQPKLHGKSHRDGKSPSAVGISV